MERGKTRVHCIVWMYLFKHALSTFCMAEKVDPVVQSMKVTLSKACTLWRNRKTLVKKRATNKKEHQGVIHR